MVRVYKIKVLMKLVLENVSWAAKFLHNTAEICQPVKNSVRGSVRQICRGGESRTKTVTRLSSKMISHWCEVLPLSRPPHPHLEINPPLPIHLPGDNFSHRLGRPPHSSFYFSYLIYLLFT